MSSGSSKPRIRDRFKRFLNRKGKQGSSSTQPLSQSSSSTQSQSNVSVVPNVVRSNSMTNVPSILDCPVPARSETAIQSPSNDAPTAAMTRASSNDVVSSNLPTLSNNFSLVLSPSAAAPSSVHTHSWTEPLRAPAGTGWKILKDTLNVVIQVSGPVPPLQLAVGGVLVVMNLIEMAVGEDEKREEFVAIASKIQAFAEIIKRSQDISGKRSAVFQDRINGIVQAMNLLEHSIRNKIDRGIVKRVLSSSSDAQVVANAFTSLTSLIEMFSLEQMFEIESNTESIRAGMDELKYEANLNSLASVTTASYRNQKDKPTCLEGTRVTILDDLLSWALDPNSPRVYWLNGIAGTGKSTITRSLCGLLRSNDLFGAAFFCSRDSANQSTVQRIMPSLAHFLAREHIVFGSELHSIITDDKELAQLRVLDEQLEKLLILPSERAFRTRRQAPIIIIDALDECSDGKDIANFLQLILQKSLLLPFKLFITSRPVNEIEMRFSLPDSKNHSVFHLHNVEDFFIRADITLYLTKELENIRTDHRLPSDWPTTNDITVLTNLSDKLFIYASTALKYIAESPESRFKRLVAPHARASAPLTKDLDTIYHLILRDAVDPTDRDEEEITDTTRVLAAIITVQEILPLNVLGKLLNIGTHRVQDALKFLHALILIQDDGYISTFHASLADYLTDPRRSEHERWFVDQSLAHCNITHDCLRIVQSELKFNLSGIQSSYERNSAHKYTPSLSAQVSYASRFWVDHAISTSEFLRMTVLDQITKFLHTKFLFWIEALSILGMGYQASSMIRSLSVSLEKVHEVTASILVILKDCNDFLVAFREPISTSTPHIYQSALAFVSPTSWVSQNYWAWFPRIPRAILAGSASLNTTPLLKLESHTDRVTSVAFSSNGKRIISGSYDLTIRVWDAETGKEALSPLEGHTDWVTSVAFSSDGKRIVSGSYDRTIRVWDAETGKEALSPLEGHTDGVTSVAFSSDGKRIVSGSYDHTIRVWDAETGKEALSPLEGHINWVTSVAFSSDGKRIVSGSRDRTIRVWDAETGKETLSPLEGHTNWVTSVAFSSDGKRIISDSGDITIRVWDAETGKEALSPLEGHTDGVTSVAFSSDGKRIVSGSGDHTIRVWDAETGKEALSPLEGHTNGVTSVTFSSDGKRIVSGSGDHTIRVWDTETGKEAMSPLEGHMEITSVALSNDGKPIISDPSNHTAGVENVLRDQLNNSAAFSSNPRHSFSAEFLRARTENGDLRDAFCMKDGWIVGPSDELILWIPLEYRTALWRPRMTLMIAQSRVELDLSKFEHGSRWTNCYNPGEPLA